MWTRALKRFARHPRKGCRPGFAAKCQRSFGTGPESKARALVVEQERKEGDGGGYRTALGMSSMLGWQANASGTALCASGTAAPKVLATAATATIPAGVVSFLQVAPPIAAQIVFLSPLSAMRQFKKDGTTGDVSPIPYAAMAVNGFAWVLYGTLKGDMTIVLPNASGFLFGAYYVKTFSDFKAPHVNMTPYYGGVVAMCTSFAGCAALLETDTAINAIGLGACGVVAVMFGGPLGSIKTVIKDQNTNSLPVPFTLAAFVNCVCWSSYGWFVIDDAYVWGPNIAGLCASSAQIMLYLKYGLPQKK